MKEIQWPNLSQFGARLVVSPANEHRSKTAMLLVENFDLFKKEIEQSNPNRSFEQVLVDAHFLEVENEEKKYAYYYKNPAKSGIDLNDLKIIFPRFTKELKVPTPADKIYLTQLPFSKNFSNWRNYFSSTTERFAQFPDVFISKKKSDQSITEILSDSIQHANKSYLAQFQASNIPFNRLEDYGYKRIFSKVYLDEETALSNGESPDDLVKIKLSPFSVPINFENNGSILIIEDLRQIPEIFAYDPFGRLDLENNINLVHFAHDFETTFNQLIRHNDDAQSIFRMSIKDMQEYISHLADDLALIDQLFYQPEIAYPTFSDEVKAQGIPYLYQDDLGTWQSIINGDEERLSDFTLYNAAMLRHEFLGQMVKQLPNNKVFDTALNKAYMELTVSLVPKYNKFYDHQSAVIQQKQLENALNSEKVEDILTDLDVNFNAQDKQSVSEIDLLNIATGGIRPSVDTQTQLKQKLRLPNDMLDEQSNEKVREFAPSVLEVRQILDAYAIPKAQEKIKKIEQQYSDFLNSKYEVLQTRIKASTAKGKFDPQVIQAISEEIDQYTQSIDQDYNEAKRTLWESETLIAGISASTDKYLFSKASFYYNKDDQNQYVKFTSDTDLIQYKADIYKLCADQFDDQLISIHSSTLQDFIGNPTAMEMLAARTNGYIDQSINENIATPFAPSNTAVNSIDSPIQTIDLITHDLANHEQLKQAYFNQYAELLDQSNFDEVLLKHNLSKIALTKFLKDGIEDVLQSSLLIAKETNTLISKPHDDSIIGDVFAKISTSKHGLSLDVKFHRLAALEGFKQALNVKYPQGDWSFLNIDSSNQNVQDIFEDMIDDFQEDVKDLKDTLASIERQFYKDGSSLFAVNTQPSASKLFVQQKPLGQKEDFALSFIDSSAFNPDTHIQLDQDPFKATVQAYKHIADYVIEKTLYLNDGDLSDAKAIAALWIANDDKGLGIETQKLLGIALQVEDLNCIHEMSLKHGDLLLNDKLLPNTQYNNLQLYNVLNLIDLNKRSLLGKFDVEVHADFQHIKDLLKPNLHFQNNLQYFAITQEEQNVNFSNELEFFEKQLENAVHHYESNNAPIAVDRNNLYLIKMQKDDIQYLRIYDQNNKSNPFIPKAVSLDCNIYKAAGFSDRDAVKVSANILFKLENRRNPLEFMPPAKFTFEKYYDSDFNYFAAKDPNSPLVKQIFTSVPKGMFDYLKDNATGYSGKLDFLQNINSEFSDRLEDLLFDKQVDDVKKLLENISPRYAYVMAHIDGQTALLPKNLTEKFNITEAAAVHPFDLVHPKLQKHDLEDLFLKGVDTNEEAYISKLKFRITLGQLERKAGHIPQPVFFTEQNAVNEAFAPKYAELGSMHDVNTVLLNHVQELKNVVEKAYLNKFPGSNPSQHNYKLMNRQAQDDSTPQLYVIDHFYEKDLVSTLNMVVEPTYRYQLIEGFDEPEKYRHEILKGLKTKAKLGTILENLALSSLPEVQVPHKVEYADKKLISLNYQSLVTNVLGTLYDQTDVLRPYISEDKSKLCLAIKPSTDSDYASLRLFKDIESIDQDYKMISVFPLRSMTSVEDVLKLQKIVLSDFDFIDQLIPKKAYAAPQVQKVVDADVSAESEPKATYLGDVGKKFGGAHKDRYGEYISLEYISATSADQSAIDYRKAKIISNKEFQTWYQNTNLGIDDKIFVKAMYDYCPTKPLFSKNALMIDSQRANELRAYVAVVSNLRNLMVDTQEELFAAIRNKQHLTADSLGFTDRQRRDYIALYSKGTKFNYKNYFELLSDLDHYYIKPGHTGTISVQLEKIIEKTIDKEFSKILATGKIFDFYGKSKVDQQVSDAIGQMQRTGHYAPILEPFILKSAIDSGLVQAESAPIFVKDPLEPKTISTMENDVEVSEKQPKTPSFTSEITVHENGYIEEKLSSELYGLLNYTRVGPDYRQGKDVDSFALKNTYCISGVEIGNKVSPVAQPLVNAVYDSLNDLKQLMGFQDNEGFLNVGLALASRGIKDSAAHFELTKNVVNLTRDNGSGSLAHEYAHALDAYLGTIEKAELYKNIAKVPRNELEDYYENIKNFDIPNARHFLSEMLDQDYNPLTPAGMAFEKVYKAMMYQPLQHQKSYLDVQKEAAEQAIKEYYNILDQCEDEVLNHQAAYASTDRQTLVKFFDWHEKHYTDLINRQFDKIEDYLKKYQSEYINDEDLSFFKLAQDKVNIIISKINTDINGLSFKSYERLQERENVYRGPNEQLPTKGVEQKIHKIFTAADINIQDMSDRLAEYLAETSKCKFYELVEKYIPEPIQDPYTKIQNFFNPQVGEINQDSRLVFSTDISKYKQQCLNKDRAMNKTKPYYATSTEMFARYFETYLYSKIVLEKDISNTFLIDGYPTVKPTGLEFEICTTLTSELVQSCANELFNTLENQEQDMHIKAQQDIEKKSDNLDMTI